MTMFGTTARGDWRDPKVLNGRTVTTGRSKECQKLSASLSAAIFVAEYGDCARTGWFSSIGVVTADPYTSLVEVWTNLGVCSCRAAWSKFKVPSTLVSA